MAQPDDHLFVLGEVGSGRASLLGEMMAREAASRPVPPDFKADCERIEADHQSEEEQAFATLSALAEARNFGLIREQGRMVFTRKREKPRPSGRGGRAQARAASRWLGG